METICICGGGSLGHVIAGGLAHKGYQVNLLTRRPENWNQEIIIETADDKTLYGQLNKISSFPQEVIPQSGMILFCLPGFLINEELIRIKDYLSEGATMGSVVSSTGFFIMAERVLQGKYGLFGFQRVPYIARVKEYGKKASLLGYKSQLKVSMIRMPDENVFLRELQNMFDTPVTRLNHVLESTLSNSNPLLHPARLYSLFSGDKATTIYPKEILFYEEWDNDSSELLIACDKEFQSVIEKLPVDKSEMPSLLEYYDSTDAESLTRKMRSIEAFKKIKAPFLPVENGFVPDFNNRYFTEDIPYGLTIIKYIASLLEIQTPSIDRILGWSQKLIGMDLLQNGNLTGKDVSSLPCLDKQIIETFIYS